MSEHLQKMAGAGFNQFQVHQRFNRGAPKKFLESFLRVPFVSTIYEPRHISPSPFAELWILRVKVSLREFAAQCRLRVGVILGLEELLCLGTVFRAQTLPCPSLTILGVESALRPIGSTVKAVFVLHGLCSPGNAEIYPNLPDHRYRAVTEEWPLFACLLTNCGFSLEKGTLSGIPAPKTAFLAPCQKHESLYLSGCGFAKMRHQ